MGLFSIKLFKRSKLYEFYTINMHGKIVHNYITDVIIPRLHWNGFEKLDVSYTECVRRHHDQPLQFWFQVTFNFTVKSESLLL